MQQIKDFILKFALPFLLGGVVAFGYISVSGESVSSCDCEERLSGMERTLNRVYKKVKNIERTVVKVGATDKKVNPVKAAPAPTAK